MMMNEEYRGYSLSALPQGKKDGRWGVAVAIKKQVDKSLKEQVFFDDERVAFILKVEAEKECINLGKALIRNNIVPF